MESSESQIDAGMRVDEGLYSVALEISGARRGNATGIVVLDGGRILDGDSFFYYTGSYSFSRGKWRGELIVNQHTQAPGLNLAFAGREVTCGFTGTYSAGAAEINGTALVGPHSTPFSASMTLKAPIWR